MKLKEISRSAIQSWSPASHHPIYLATGTSAKQLDASFSSNASLEIFQLDLAEPSLDMKLCGTFPTSHRYHKMVWGPHGMQSEGLPSGVLIAGGENGDITLYDPAKIIAGQSDAIISQSDKHTGPVRALDVNPFQTNLIASGGNESEIYIWDMNNFGSPMTPGPKTQPLEDVSCVGWNRQVAHILASASPGGRASVWDLRKNDLIIKVSDHSNRMHCSGLAWNPEVATQLVLASEDDRMPVIQMWDLRFATSPLKIFENHTRGVLSIAWSLADPELLLSCGKDSRILCWNPNTAEVVYELPASTQWCFDIQWCPRNPAVLSAAAFDGHIGVYSIMGGSNQAQNQRDADQISNSFGNMDPFGLGQTLPPLQLPQTSAPPATAKPLKKPPKWLRRPVGASFAFGGKLVSLENVKAATPQQPAPPLVHVSQVVTETALLERSRALQATLSAGDYHHFCQSKIDTAQNDFERTVWSFLKVNFDDDVREKYLELLGYKKEELALKISAALEEKTTHPGGPVEPLPVVELTAPPPANLQLLADSGLLPCVNDSPAAVFDLIAQANVGPADARLTDITQPGEEAVSTEPELPVEETDVPLEEEAIAPVVEEPSSAEEPPALVEEPVAVPAPVEEPTVIPAPVEEPPVIPAPVEEPTVIPAPVEEPPVIPAPVEEPPVIPAPVEEPTVIPAPVEEPTVIPAPVEEPTVIPAPVEEPMVIPAPLEVPPEVPVLEEEHAEIPALVEGTAGVPAMFQVPSMFEGSAAFPDLIEGSAAFPAPIEGSAEFPAFIGGPAEVPFWTQEPGMVPVLSEEPATIPFLTEEPAMIPFLTEEPAMIPFLTEEPAMIPFLTEEPAMIPFLTEEPAMIPFLTEEPAMIPFLTEEPAMIPDLVEAPVGVPALVEAPVELPALVDEPLPAMVPVLTEEPAMVPVLTEEPAMVPVLTEEPAMVPVLTEEPAMVPVLTEEPAMVPVLTEEPPMIPDLVEEPVEVPAPPPATTELTTPLRISQDVDGLITQALLTGDFAGAVELCLHDNRMADSIILAIAGGTELLEKTQRKYFTKTTSKLTKLISAVVLKDWNDILQTCDLRSWKEALAAVMTYSDPDEFCTLCNVLGGRLETAADSQLQIHACLCYICAGNVEKLVSCWTKAQNGHCPLSLQELVEKVEVLRRAVERTQGSCSSAMGVPLGDTMSRYASLLASQGSLTTAIAYLPADSDQVAVQQLRERLSRALGQQQQQQQQQQQAAAVAPAALAAQPQSAPQPQPPVALPPAAFNPGLPQAMVPQPPAAAPLPMAVPAASAPVPPQYYQPVRSTTSTVTSWSNQTPTALPSAPPPQVGTGPDPQAEPSSPVYGMPPPAGAAAPPPPSSTAPQYMYSQQYQPYSQVGQLPPRDGGQQHIYQPLPYPLSAQAVSSSAPPQPPGFLAQYSQPPYYPGGPPPPPLSSSSSAPPSHHPAVLPASSAPPSFPAPPLSYSSSSSSGGPFQHGGPGSPPATYMPPTPPFGASGPQNGWNDPPALNRAPKKKGLQNYTPPAPITAPIMTPLGGEPQAAPVPSMPSQTMVQGPPGVQAPYPGLQQQQQHHLPHPPMNPAMPPTSVEGAPGAPIGDVIQPMQSIPAEKITKKPIPEEHQVLKTTFEGLIHKCLAAANDPQTKRKLDDASKRLESLYDKLREQTLSPAIVGGLHNMAKSIESRSYADCLHIHTHIVSSSNFSEISAFMPVLKVVLTQANRLGV